MNLAYRMLTRFRRPFYKLVKNQDGGFKGLSRKALLYYKTDVFWRPALVNEHKHNNNWEVLEIVKVLNKLGFCVDIVDRTHQSFIPKDEYDLFIANASGNSGKRYGEYAAALPSAFKVIYAVGPDPTLSNKLVKERYDKFNERMNCRADYQRIIDTDFDSFTENTDAIFCFGEPGQFSFKSYERYNLPIYPIMPSAPEGIGFSPEWLKTRSPKKFICIAGSGLICKGVDLIIEAFLDMPEYEVHICGPDDEPQLIKAYGTKIKKANNIHLHGFIDMCGEKLRQISSECSYVLFHSAAEGIATSVTNCLQAGLVPIINYETGFDTEGFGILINSSDERVQNIGSAVDRAAKLDSETYSEFVYGALEKSAQFSRAGFTASFSKAVIQIMSRMN